MKQGKAGKDPEQNRVAPGEPQKATGGARRDGPLSAEVRLREAARLNRLLMDSLPHPAMLIRKDRIIMAANRVARQAGAKVGGRCWSDFGHCDYIPDEDRAFLREHGCAPEGGTRCSFCLAEEALGEGKTTNNPELEAWGRIWDTYWVPLDEECYLHYAIDITIQKKMERALRKTHKRLEQRVRERTAELARANEDLRREAEERKQAEAALRESQRLLERPLSSMRLLVAYLDTEFNFVRVNRAYAEADGREPGFFVGKNHFALYPNAENEAIFRRVVESAEAYVTYAKAFEYPDAPERGTTYWDWTLQPVRDAAGEMVGV
ncbi:MAG: PAS domain-containing protein, partial [Planctomycetota bacterium]